MNTPPSRAPVRRPTLWLAGIGVLILAAAAFAVSYDGLVAVARAGGVAPRLAELYPMVFDAVIVVAAAAVVVLRSARPVVRALIWATLILLLAFVAAAGAVEATGIRLPPRATAAAVVITPWVTLALGLRMWLAMIRHVRRSRSVGEPAAEADDDEAPIIPGLRAEPTEPLPRPATAPLPVAPKESEEEAASVWGEADAEDGDALENAELLPQCDPVSDEADDDGHSPAAVVVTRLAQTPDGGDGSQPGR